MSQITFDGNVAGEHLKVTEVELIYRNKTKNNERPLIRFSDDAYKLFLNSWDENKIELQEQFKVMFLDRRNSVIGISTVATGGISACYVDPKIAFATALKTRATSIILAHNHPSGNKQPSQADINLTNQFNVAGKVLDIAVVDHIIVTNDGYTSFADEGMMRKTKDIPLTY